MQALAAAAGVQGSDEELSRNQAVKKALLDDLTATAKAGKLKVWQAAAEWGAGACERRQRWHACVARARLAPHPALPPPFLPGL